LKADAPILIILLTKRRPPDGKGKLRFVSSRKQVRNADGRIHGGYSQRAMSAIARRDDVQLPQALLRHERNIRTFDAPAAAGKTQPVFR
jgi:hypothetical protein